MMNFYFQSGEFINQSSEFGWQTIIAIISVCFALYVYWGFDVKKNVVKKQLDTVFEIINEIYNAKIIGDNKGVNKIEYTLEQVLMLWEDKSQLNMVMSGEMRFDIINLFDLTFLHYHDNPFTPKPIAIAIKKAAPQMFNNIDVLANKVKLNLDTNNPLNQNIILLRYFILNTLQVKSEIKMWLKKNRFNDLNY